MLLLVVPVHGMGATHDVVQSAGQLEPEVVVDRAPDETRELALVGPVPLGVARCGTVARRAGVVRDVVDRGEPVGPRGTSRVREVAEVDVAPLGRPAQLHAPRSIAGWSRRRWAVGDGHRCGRATRLTRSGRQSVPRGPRARPHRMPARAADRRGGIRARPVGAVRAHRVGEGRVAGGNTAASSMSPANSVGSAGESAAASDSGVMPGRLLGWPWADPPTRETAMGGCARRRPTTKRWTCGALPAAGQHPAQAAHPAPATGRGKQGGELYYEELMGEEGFSSDSSLLYHRNIPSTIAGARVGRR